MLYVDPALFGAPNGMPCIIDFFGRDRVLFGTDAPLDTQGGSRFIPTTIPDVEPRSRSRAPRVGSEPDNDDQRPNPRR
jgi:hypothetical protein